MHRANITKVGDVASFDAVVKEKRVGTLRFHSEVQNALAMSISPYKRLSEEVHWCILDQRRRASWRHFNFWRRCVFCGINCTHSRVLLFDSRAPISSLHSVLAPLGALSGTWPHFAAPKPAVVVRNKSFLSRWLCQCQTFLPSWAIYVGRSVLVSPANDPTTSLLHNASMVPQHALSEMKKLVVCVRRFKFLKRRTTRFRSTKVIARWMTLFELWQFSMSPVPSQIIAWRGLTTNSALHQKVLALLFCGSICRMTLCVDGSTISICKKKEVHLERFLEH